MNFLQSYRTCRAFALLLLAISGLTASRPGAALADISIALAGPMTGSQKVFGEQMQKGAEAAVADINATGGVLGERVVLIIKDDDCKAEAAAAAARELTETPVVMVVGHFCSDASIAAAKIYTARDIVQISPASTAPALTDAGGRNVFRVVGRDDLQGIVAGRLLATRFAGRKIAILHDGTSYGTGLAEATKAELNKAGVREAVYQVYDPEAANFAELARSLKEAAIEVIYVGGYYTESAKLIRAAHAESYTPQLVSGDALVTDEFWKLTGEAGEGTLMTFYPDPRKNKEAETVVERFRKAGYEPEGFTLYTYGAIQAWAQAAQKAGSTDAKKVIAALRANTFETVLGTIGFDKKGDVTVPGFVWYQWKSGKYETIN